MSGQTCCARLHENIRENGRLTPHSEQMGPAAGVWRLQPGRACLFRYLLCALPGSIAPAHQVCHIVSSHILLLRRVVWE